MKRALYINCILSIKGTTCLSSYKYIISCTALLNAAAESILYAIYYSARNAHLAQNAAKCYKNAGKFFPDIPYGSTSSILLINPLRLDNLILSSICNSNSS